MCWGAEKQTRNHKFAENHTLKRGFELRYRLINWLIHWVSHEASRTNCLIQTVLFSRLIEVAVNNHESSNFNKTTASEVAADINSTSCCTSPNPIKADSNSVGLSPKPGLYIRTFGCQMNEYDSEKLAKILENQYRRVNNPEEAELVLINTCSVREKPEHKVYSILGQINELKQQNKDLMIGVGGCVAQQEGENLIKGSRGVDFVFGTHNLSLVPSLVQLRKNGAKPQVAVNYREEWEDLPLGFTDDSSRVSAFVSISRGCNKNCTYCIVPTTRGPEVSRSADEILREVRIAVQRGAREIILLGQTVNSYGLDFTPRDSFAALVQRVSDVSGVERIRFTSPHPQEVKKDLIKLYADNPKLAAHIHLPLQSGNDRVLKAMNRNYRRRRYLDIVAELKDKVPDIAITTDIIVGFPSETEEEFLETMDILEQVRFASSYSFAFSPRPGTAAENMAEQISQDVKLNRLQRYQARQDQISKDYLESWVGKKVDVLFDGVSASQADILKGRTPQNITVNLDKAYEDLKLGMTKTVKIIQANRFTLLGQCS